MPLLSFRSYPPFLGVSPNLRIQNGPVGVPCVGVTAWQAVVLVILGSLLSPMSLGAKPPLTITAASPVTAGAKGLSASVPAHAGRTYVWTVTGGTVTAGAGTPTLTYTAGPAGTTLLKCVERHRARIVKSGTRSVEVVAAPVAPIAAPSPVASGAQALVASVPRQTGSIYVWISAQ